LGELKETETTFDLTRPLSALAIPSTLHDSLMARLDRLQPVKEVAQTAACIGREFDTRLLSELLALGEEALQHALDQLVAAELVFRRGRGSGAVFIFKHALVRDAAYESLLKTRRRAIHKKLVEALETREETAPEVFAHHALKAGLKEKAIAYLRQAGNAAGARPAYQEAITHISSAIALIGEMPERAAWHQSELELQLQLAQLLMTKIGYGCIEARQAFTRAKALLDLTDDQELKLPVTYGLWIVHYIRAEHQDSLSIATRLVEEVDRQEADIPKMAAHRMLAATLLAQGKPQIALGHLETSLEFYQPSKVAEYAARFAQEPSIQVRVYLVLCLWTLGYADQAGAHMASAEAAARELEHVNTRCYAALHWSLLAICNRDDELLRQNSQLLVDYSIEYGLALWKTYGDFGLSLLSCRAGAPGAFEVLQQTFDDYAGSGCRLFWGFYKGEQAKELLRAGRHDEALETIQEAIAFTEETGERWVEADLHVARGEILLAVSRIGDAEASFLSAIEIAKQQEAKAWEVRATLSLARHWADRGEKSRARDLLSPAIDWFTEGFDTADLKAAKALLDDLS
jgi:predicted ATPase